MSWIEYHTALRDHWKIDMLALELNVDYATALGHISLLWLWTAQYSPKGDLKRFTDEQISSAARFKGEKFSKNTLKKCSLMNDKDFINDWGKHGVRLLISSRKKQKRYRDSLRNGDVTVTSFSPSLSLSILSNKELAEKYKFLQTEKFVTVFTDYLEMRKKIKRPATERAVEMALTELHKHSFEDAVKMLEKSILNSWQGIFPLRNNEKVKESYEHVL